MDNYSAMKVQRVISPAAVGTTGAGNGTTGKIVDRRGYIGPVLFDVAYGSVTATNATVTPVVLEGDVTGALTSVADIDLIGTEAAAGIGQAASRVSGTSKNVSKKIAYNGNKRYATMKLYSTVTAATLVTVNALQRAASQPAP